MTPPPNELSFDEAPAALSVDEKLLSRVWAFVLANPAIFKRVTSHSRIIQRLRVTELVMASETSEMPMSEMVKLLSPHTEERVARAAVSLVHEVELAFDSISRAAREKKGKDDELKRRPLLF